MPSRETNRKPDDVTRLEVGDRVRIRSTGEKATVSFVPNTRTNVHGVSLDGTKEERYLRRANIELIR